MACKDTKVGANTKWNLMILEKEGVEDILGGVEEEQTNGRWSERTCEKEGLMMEQNSPRRQEFKGREEQEQWGGKGLRIKTK